MSSNYEREVAERFLRALDDLWSATDYREAQDISWYEDDELKKILGEWEQIRRVCDYIYIKIRDGYPELEGWDPIRKDRPLMGLDDDPLPK